MSIIDLSLLLQFLNIKDRGSKVYFVNLKGHEVFLYLGSFKNGLQYSLFTPHGTP